ncbi:hypothetical protein PSTG_11599 [Puccinia striiformis f. sp. tritici PST-78]|uniref:DAGKc domain-containing protein n=1 Tax=Puccinia striiformis f. sp. tritici PST-78 TaxID=1165861 RepID=A0A0L0V771_9BASI|nr:hypothetical protein PSTG_11599 [Puccinia striiformis f. sp. tritici PST-78]
MTECQHESDSGVPSPSSTLNSISQQMVQPSLSLSLVESASDGFEKVQLSQSDRSLSLHFTRSARPNRACLPFSANKPAVSDLEIGYINILNCQLDLHDQQHEHFQLRLSFLNQKLKLKTITLLGSIENSRDENTNKMAQHWRNNLLLRSYEFRGVPRSRRVLIIINPTSGSQKSLKTWSSIVEPILKASTADYQVIFTTHSGHAGELAEKLDLDSLDVVSCVSGDGLVHEVLNGLGRRKSDFMEAMNKIALTSIPCGSGNGLSTNHLGPKHAANVQLATLNVLKGKSIRLDLCSSTQLSSDQVGPSSSSSSEGQKNEEQIIRKLSLLSTSFGIMAELDVGTEHLRRLGPIRFVLGYLWGAIRNRQRKIRLDVQLIEKDKSTIENNFLQLRQNLLKTNPESLIHEDQQQSELGTDSNGLPTLKYGDIRSNLDSSHNDDPHGQNNGKWTRIETNIVSFYAGILPYMSRELLLFPAKVPGHDGSIDITLQHSNGVWDSLACLIGAETGGLFKNQNCEFMKVKAFRLSIDVEDKSQSYVVLDGENLPYRSIQVEIHERAFHTLTLNHTSDDQPQPPYFGSIGVPDRIL